MTMDVKNLVLEKIRQRCPAASLQIVCDAAMPLSDLQLDSLSILELVYELEEHFRIIVDEQRLLKLNTVDDVVGMISSALEQRAAD